MALDFEQDCACRMSEDSICGNADMELFELDVPSNVYNSMSLFLEDASGKSNGTPKNTCS